MSEVSAEIFPAFLLASGSDELVPNACHDLRELFLTMNLYCAQIQILLTQTTNDPDQQSAMLELIEAFNAEISQATVIVNTLQASINK
jgi:hypothetical protein